MGLRVWYGFTKLTPKIVRQAELAIYFENSYNGKNENWIARHIHIVHVRQQTSGEVKDGEQSNRMFTKYGYFIDLKPFCGDIEKVLELNMLADRKNVSQEKLELIRDQLRKEFYAFYNRKPIVNRQLRLEFE